MSPSPRPPLLLTPGPLTTSPLVRLVMGQDWGSRDPQFIALTAELRYRLLDVAHALATHVSVPIQGSGTYVLEAAVGSLIAPADKLLILANGAYGERMAEIAQRLGRRAVILRWEEDQPVEAVAVTAAVADDPEITHVAMVHCETTTGILNPVEAVAAAVAAAGRRLLVDAMSSFGALPLDLLTTPIGAVLASANKCLEGAPGIAFALVERDWIAASQGVNSSVSLDLHAQWRGFEETGQWRFTPPVQVVAAAVEALRLLEAEGGPPARLRRYRANLEVLMAGAAALGLRPVIEPGVQAPIIATFHMPADPQFDFSAFYAALGLRGFVIYPGKLARAPSFRIGCIGAVDAEDFRRLVAILGPALEEAGARVPVSAQPN